MEQTKFGLSVVWIDVVESIQGHSRGIRLDPKLQNNVRIRFGWTDSIYHVGSSLDYRSIADASLLAGRN